MPYRFLPRDRLTYGHFEATGRQDCANAFDTDMFMEEWRKHPTLDAQAIVDRVWKELEDEDDWKAQWLEQQDDFEGLDPERCYEFWRAGWKACAVRYVAQDIKDAKQREQDERDAEAWYEQRERGRDNPAARAQRVVLKTEKGPELYKKAIETPADVLRALKGFIGDRATETFVVVFLNARNVVVGYTELTELSVASVSVNVGGIIREALAVGAVALISAHQHPSGDPTPSDADRQLWRRLDEAAQIVGLVVLDHMVLGDAKFYASSEGRQRDYPGGSR